MKKIYKYAVGDLLADNFSMPKDAEFMDVQIENHMPIAWFYMDIQAEPELRKFFIVYGTGHTIGDNDFYLATWQQGPFVWHLFEHVDLPDLSPDDEEDDSDDNEDSGESGYF